MLTGWKLYIVTFLIETVPPILVGLLLHVLGAPTWATALTVLIGVIYMKTITSP